MTPHPLCCAALWFIVPCCSIISYYILSCPITSYPTLFYHVSCPVLSLLLKCDILIFFFSAISWFIKKSKFHIWFIFWIISLLILIFWYLIPDRVQEPHWWPLLSRISHIDRLVVDEKKLIEKLKLKKILIKIEK